MVSKGFIKGRPAQLHVLDFGLFKVHANGRVIGICGFLIVTDVGERILIDTGFPAKYARDAARASKEDNLGEFGEVLALSAGNLPAPQLAKSGVLPGDIDLLIMTHTHIDHVGGLADFPGAPILIAKAERDLPKPLYWRGAQPMDWPVRDYMLVTQDFDLGPGLRILLVPGHAPGQLAVLLDMPDSGPMLLVSDAISRPAEIDEKFAGSWDDALAIVNGARLMALARETGAQVIYGHCPEQWPNLRKTPEHFT
ncbi:N-acyl homoserine lactonase family protein [Planktotalea arctica]|uniref:N-acyl homoserine lactonase family protein n=1 Tax=Planktotalea arctica TaxID=1481893 RepID=UPI000A1724DB|nr:N-acyl homoserine lactonase family protein [Planktotalea arctica]